ncbi:MAG: hypothetical protein DME25_05185, partial [Verrucomicrobia bacterium]
CGPFKQWRSQAARTLAGRLTANLGAYRLSQVLHWRAWRADRTNPDLAAYHGYTLLQRRGPLAAYDFFESFGQPAENGDPDALMHFLTLRARIAAELRDFSVAEADMNRAKTLTPEHPWLATCQAHILEFQDRYAEALAAARRALELRPWYRPGVQALAHVLQLLDRDEEALALLSEAAARLENMHVVRQMSLLQQELRLYEPAVASLARLEELAPLMEKPEQLWLQRQRVTLDCLRRDLPSALTRAKQIDEPYYRELAQRIEKGPLTPALSPSEGERDRAAPRLVYLEVPFVRQHHMTCAPATLSAISRFWRQPAEHLEVAEAICYDGTSAHSERNWAETHGWRAREFTVTWEAAVALLDRGIPFTLTTSEATSGHLQAVVGYDELRQTLWIRDPFFYSTNEFAVKPLLERYRASGPRGLALAPAARPELLEGLDLPDAALYDELHLVQQALEEHRRADALAACLQMQSTAPEHRLTLSGGRAIASYDSNTPALLECLEQLLKQFPHDGNLNLCKLGCLRELARRAERLQMLEKLSTTPGTDPIFWQLYAQELRADARQQRAAASWVRWALRYRPTDPALISAWADLLWDQREFAKAVRYYRFAACLGDKREHFSRSLFIASRHLRQTESALQFLKERDARLGKKSPDPTITLIESLQHLGRTSEAFDVLRAALARRPGDGPLRLFAADFHGRFSRFEAANQLLAEARPRCPPIAWHRAAASLAEYQHRKPDALAHWREVLQIEPLAHDAIRAIALLLAETESREAALRFLNELCERFPFSCPLLGLRIHWLKEDGSAALVPYLRQFLEVNPADGWAWRELALHLEAQADKTEALAAADEAIRLEPQHSAGYSVRGDILVQSSRLEDGHADFRQALRLEVDNDYALTQYVDSAPGLAARKQALSVVAEELRRQVIFRDALSAYQRAARGLLPPQEVVSLLREANAARPDLWQAWSVLIVQLVDVGSHDEALALAREATERFPLVPRLWVDLARVEQARLEAAGEIRALEKALEISPGYAYASRQLADACERKHDLAKARAVLEQAVAANPLDAQNHAGLAHILWKQGERETALTRIQHVLRLEPGYEWAWKALTHWGATLGRPALAAETARDLTRVRAGEARSWLLLAETLSSQKEAEELFAALERAVALNPHCEEAYDLRARALSELNRFDEALRQCEACPIQPIPPRLRIRAAWIEAQRGNLASAIARAKAAMEDFPDYYAGWQFLSEWCLRAQQADEAVSAAEKMAALAPLQPVPLGYLGDLKLRLKDRDGAKQAFQRAFTLDPDYQYAGFHLFQMTLADRSLDEAEQILKVLSRQGQDSRTVACSIELAAARYEWPQALDLFGTLCADANADYNALASAVDALDRHKGRHSVDKLLHKHLSHGSPAPALAEFWVHRQVSRGRWALRSRLKALSFKSQPPDSQPSAIGRRAVLCYLDHLGEA